ncbi:MAG: hypothetical protein D3910_04020, partial [Candidatus Electrothrix sp. ATG2]|nr:hypothetical protein [Candidatus Electrothrix sp. ATG2]
MKKLSLGIQDFPAFKADNLIYVDKTKLIHRLIDDGRYYFLSRPRRFSKSLLVSTMQWCCCRGRHMGLPLHTY